MIDTNIQQKMIGLFINFKNPLLAQCVRCLYTMNLFFILSQLSRLVVNLAEAFPMDTFLLYNNYTV